MPRLEYKEPVTDGTTDERRFTQSDFHPGLSAIIGEIGGSKLYPCRNEFSVDSCCPFVPW